LVTINSELYWNTFRSKSVIEVLVIIHSLHQSSWNTARICMRCCV